VIMTSNVGAPLLLEGLRQDGEIEESVRKQVMDELRMKFRPEFLNRVDEIVLFKPLQRAEIEKIVDLLADQLRARLRQRQMTLELSRKARQFIANKGFDPVYGARPLKRFLQRELETRIGRALIAGSVEDGAKIRVDVRDGELVVEPENPVSAVTPP